jgi:hypothetical protein
MDFNPLCEFPILQDIFEKIAGSPPNDIYHYTDAKGALGIVHDGTLWATLASHLNDKTELKYARQVITRVVKLRAANANNSHAAYLKKIGAKFLRRRRFDWYIVSFTTLRDHTAHYLKYCKTDPQLCLEFNLRRLAARLAHPSIISKIVYSTEEQIQVINATIDALLSLIDNLRSPTGANNMSDEKIVKFGIAFLEYLLPMFKSCEWITEEEVRLILPRKFITWYYTAKIHKRNGRKINYIIVPIAGHSVSPPPLTKIYYNSKCKRKDILTMFNLSAAISKNKLSFKKSSASLRPP